MFRRCCSRNKGKVVVQTVELCEVQPVKVIGTEGLVALGALPLARLVPRLQAVVAEDVEALVQHGVLPLRLAAGTGQLFLQLANFLLCK